MMTMNATRARKLAWQLVLLAALGAMCGCPRGGTENPNELLYAHGRIHVDKETAARWNAGEAEIAAEAEKLHPIPADARKSSIVPFSGDARAMLLALQPSGRHGATDKRMLSILGGDRSRKVFQSSGIVAQITLVKGSEYKSEAHFRKGWLPMAIVVLPDTFPPGAIVYPKLALHGGTSWIFVREESHSKWLASLVRIADGKVEQDSLDISVASDDVVEPVIGARFVWEDDDESIWGYCGGGCCKIRAIR
ncbi:MAG TPA: hypothetical protein VGJ12_13175 [Gemmatimonadaceae bacterium]